MRPSSHQSQDVQDLENDASLTARTVWGCLRGVYIAVGLVLAAIAVYIVRDNWANGWWGVGIGIILGLIACWLLLAAFFARRASLDNVFTDSIIYVLSNWF